MEIAILIALVVLVIILGRKVPPGGS